MFYLLRHVVPEIIGTTLLAIPVAIKCAKQEQDLKKYVDNYNDSDDDDREFNAY